MLTASDFIDDHQLLYMKRSRGTKWFRPNMGNVWRDSDKDLYQKEVLQEHEKKLRVQRQYQKVGKSIDACFQKARASMSNQRLKLKRISQDIQKQNKNFEKVRSTNSETRKKELFYLLKKMLFKKIFMKVSNSDVHQTILVASKPISTPSARRFLNHLKLGENKEALEMLNSEPRLIFEYDKVEIA